MPSSKPDCACALRRKAGTVTSFGAAQSVLCSPVCRGISRKTGIIRAFRGKYRRDFSALQTAWRRARDSNPRYKSETCRSRRLRKLQGINLLSGDRGPSGVASLGQTSPVSNTFERRMAGDLWLKVVSTTSLKRPKCFARDCVPTAQSKSKKMSPMDTIPRKANVRRSSQISCLQFCKRKNEVRQTGR